MRFETADKACEMIVDFMLSCGGCYTENRIGQLQEFVLKSLASKQYVLRIKDGQIKYYACWWYLHDEDVDMVMKSRKIPQDIFNGKNVYVAEVASVMGDARDMIKRIIKKAGGRGGRAYWHKPHRNGKSYQHTRYARR